MQKRIAMFIYGVACYGLFFATFLYAIGFIGDLLISKSMDSPSRIPFWSALGIDVLLLGIFSVQHSVMARPWFKRAWTRVVPEAAERSTYVLFSSVAMIALFAFWQPLGGVVWSIQNAEGQLLMYALMLAGFGLVLVSSFFIDHFDLFGLRQVWFYLRGRPYQPVPFRSPALYKYVRHPLYVGWFMAFWFTPLMTGTHLLFALLTTAYILAAIRWEEKDLAAVHGEKYVSYRESVPMFLPSAQANKSIEQTQEASRVL